MLAAYVTAAAPLTLRAQADGAHIVARDAGATMQRLASGVYAIVHEPAMLAWPAGAVDWPHGNTGVVVGNDRRARRRLRLLSVARGGGHRAHRDA